MINLKDRVRVIQGDRLIMLHDKNHPVSIDVEEEHGSPVPHEAIQFAHHHKIDLILRTHFVANQAMLPESRKRAFDEFHHAIYGEIKHRLSWILGGCIDMDARDKLAKLLEDIDNLKG